MLTTLVSIVGVWLLISVVAGFLFARGFFSKTHPDID